MQNSTTYNSSISKNFLLSTLHGFIILCLTSQVSIPLEPVPITLQTVGVMLIGLTFNRDVAISSVLAYLTFGAFGAPIFSGLSGGIHIFVGPTAGYLIGFLAAVIVMTTIQKHFKSDDFLAVFLNATIGTLVIFIFGISWLTMFSDFSTAIQLGFMPFIIPGILKVLLTCFSIRYIKFGKEALYK